MNNNDKRLIEVAFPLRQTSIDSVHEKNVRHGHISTLHIWPARRPLAACRAALIATLLPDPGDKEKRDELLQRLGGALTRTVKKKKMPNGRIEEIEAQETTGGILHWGRESGSDLDWFRAEIRNVYGGRAPKVLDPFAGGGAIPLEAMRLGCEVTAVDINPVAWFILKCTLEYPQKLAGQRKRLPEFALADAEFMAAYLKAKGLKPADIAQYVGCIGRTRPDRNQGDLFARLPLTDDDLEADLAWHVRAWGRWVLKRARRDLARFYPTYAEYCCLKPYARVELDTGEPLKLVPVNDDGEPQIDLLNAGFDRNYLERAATPRWIAKPTVAYLWARTVKCKACRATVPLLKTRWLVKKDNKRVLLTMTPNSERTGVVFGLDFDAKSVGGNAAQKRESDKRQGSGTISRAGATCPCCGTIMTMTDIQLEARAGRIAEELTAAVTDGPSGKEYREVTSLERSFGVDVDEALAKAFATLPFGELQEPISAVRPSPNTRGVSGLTRYGITTWSNVFSRRQRLAIASLSLAQRSVRETPSFPQDATGWGEAICSYLACALSRFADRASVIATWQSGAEQINHTFAKFVLQLPWDFAESNPLGDSSGGFLQGVEWVSRFLEHSLQATSCAPAPILIRQSAITAVSGKFDQIVTDPPYYDAIPYSDLMDFFHVWLRRTLQGLSGSMSDAFSEPLGPKWDPDKGDGELVDQPGRFDNDVARSRKIYESGMAVVFRKCYDCLADAGRLVVVFANKSPDAWEALVAALIRSGFTVDGSWPIQTERAARTNALVSATLASSIWLVCRKRDPLARAGWDTHVLKEMEASITTKLRDFWDAGIRGPDFIWAATGPALESYSRYPAVKKASEPGALMSVTDFLGHVRRIVVDFVVGRVLSHGQGEPTPGDHPLDDVTTYYLLHRNDFALKEAPAGPCILYAVSCSLSERELTDQYELLVRSGSAAATEDEEDAGNEVDGDADESPSSGGGGKYKLRDWRARKHRSLGMATASGRAIPLIDQVHKLMQLWVAGDVVKVNEFLDSRALRRSQVFIQLIQALIEKSRAEGCTEECSIQERLQNYLRSVGSTAQAPLGLE
jgi:putative DNA methylase